MSDPPILSRASSKATAKKTGASESTTATRARAKTTVPQQTGVTSTAKATASKPPAATTTVPKSTGAKARAPKAAGGTTTSKPREVSVGTDAAFASGSGRPRRRLKNISEVRHFFRTNDVPIYFFGATPFNLLGLDRWVRNFSYITYYDAWDGAHSRVFTPSDKPYQEFESGEEINNWLLTNPEVRAHIDSDPEAGCDPRSRWCSSTARPRRSARNWATT